MKRNAVCVFRDSQCYVIGLKSIEGEMDGSKFSFTLPSGPRGTQTRYLYLAGEHGRLLYCVPPGLEKFAADCSIFPGNDERDDAIFINEIAVYAAMPIDWDEIDNDFRFGSGWQRNETLVAV